MNKRLETLVAIVMTGAFTSCLCAGPFPEHGVTPEVAVAWATVVIESQNQSPASNILGPVDSNWAIGYPGGGMITVGFGAPIYNGPGSDFAVWENAFLVDGNQGTIFAELGFIDVSTDGNNWVTFPSIYLDDPNEYTNIDPTNVYNLAGNYISHYVPVENREGTPFDLDDILNTSEVISGLVDPDEINYIRIRDIIGAGAGGQNYDQATYFSCAQCDINHRISDGDPLVDLGGGGGADWDAVGVINTLRLAADFNQSQNVDLVDLIIFSQAWQSQPGDDNWKTECDIFSSVTDVINLADFAVFAGQWLKP
jgi:hypothetical protein